MNKYKSFKAAYAHFGARPSNPRMCWSARCADGSVVVLTFWNAARQWDDRKRVYDIMDEDRYEDGELHPWVLLPGNRLRKRDIEQAFASAAGRVRGLLVQPENPYTKRFEWLVRDKTAPITALDGWYNIRCYEPETGAFRAELIA